MFACKLFVFRKSISTFVNKMLAVQHTFLARHTRATLCAKRRCNDRSRQSLNITRHLPCCAQELVWLTPSITV